MDFMGLVDDENDVKNIWIAASDGDIERVKQLLLEGIFINAQDEHGYSALHAAVSYGHAELIEFLLAHGADLHLRDPDGDTPFLVCEEPAILSLLLSKGAQLGDRNNEGDGIWEKAIEDENEELISYLVANNLIDDVTREKFIQQSAASGNIQEETEDDLME